MGLPKEIRLFAGVAFVLIVAICIIFYVSRRFTEGFSSVSDHGTLVNNNNEYFGKKINRALFYNDGLESTLPDLSKAFSITDILTNVTGPTDISKYFDKSPFPGLAANNQVCSSVLEPKLLPSRTPSSVQGCGWWYVDDDNIPSLGANGTELGPFTINDLEKSHRGGRWLWDLEAAQKLEDVKRCRRVRSCDLADLVPGRCAFCPALNTGVPIDERGISIYENDPALNCSNKAIVNPANCPRPEPPNRPDGVTAAPIPLLCDPNPATGKLSNECLIALAKGAGCNEAGVIIHILAGDAKGYYSQPGANNIKFNVAKQAILDDTSIATNSEYLGHGSCLRSDALGYYNTICKLSRTASTKRARDAAGFFAFGLDYDDCEMKDSQTGPFYLHCLQRAASEAGCQPDGTAYPTDANKGDYDAKTWKGVYDYFNNLYAAMNSDNTDTQITSAKRCLGVSISRPPADAGNKAGVSIYVYRWEYESDIGQGGVAGGKISKATYYGRMIKPTYPEINNNGIYTPFGIGTDRIYMRFRTRIKSSTTISTRFFIMTDDGVSITLGDPMLGGTNILRKWFDQPPRTYETPPFTLLDSKSTEVTTDWFNNYGGYVILHRLWMNDKFIPILPNMIEQVQPSAYPIARWDFYEGIIQDRCRVLDSEVIGNVSITKMGGLKCAHFEDRSFIRIINPLAATAFKSITMTVYLNKAPNGYPRLWEFTNSKLGNYNSSSNEWCKDSLGAHLRIQDGVSFYCQQACKGSYIASGDETVTAGKWYHFAWVIDDDYTGLNLYVNGALAKSYRSQSFNILKNKVYSNCYIMNSVEQWSKDAGVGWFRIFDYTMTQDDVVADSMNAWFDKTQFTPSHGSGWDRISKSHSSN